MKTNLHRVEDEPAPHGRQTCSAWKTNLHRAKANHHHPRGRTCSRVPAPRANQPTRQRAPSNERANGCSRAVKRAWFLPDWGEFPTTTQRLRDDGERGRTERILQREKRRCRDEEHIGQLCTGRGHAAGVFFFCGSRSRESVRADAPFLMFGEREGSVPRFPRT